MKETNLTHFRMRPTFEILIAGERVYVPPFATVEIEYERLGLMKGSHDK